MGSRWIEKYYNKPEKEQLWEGCLEAFKERDNADRVFKDAYIIPK
ncbi:hypothetical protein GCM10008904_28200 [Paraclostridium ghonii]|uniref:Uncharacterized protein n=1 Tax=Paraclostridium ghonii TaxID=29358 RepID=A0ABU0N4E6_9FIRM|nr:hypothetical protein [Paeniclostridium ghonii]MDQ0557693.1 hypothetical protein [Paeniclostridium ghonii]